MLRVVRVAWWVACGVTCALMIWLWVRSYSRWDSPHGSVRGHWNLQLNSLRGYVFLGVSELEHGGGWEWRWRTFRAETLTDSGATGTVSWQLTKRIGALGFGVVSSDGMNSVYVPYWFLAALPAAAPWIASRRYQLRTLLMAMTAAALVLGAVAAAVR